MREFLFVTGGIFTPNDQLQGTSDGGQGNFPIARFAVELCVAPVHHYSLYLAIITYDSAHQEPIISLRFQAGDDARRR